MSHILDDPFPLEPHHANVVDGAHVALRWEPTENTERYHVQIAHDPDFQEVVFEQELPADMVALIVRHHFPEDDRLYYWRVRAGNAQGWSAGERIESFTSGTAEQVGHFPDPDETEPFGPIAGLFEATTLEALAEILPGRQPAIEAALGEENPEGVEAAEVFTLGMILLGAATIVVVALLILLFAAC